MGVDFGDTNHDGLYDVFVSNLTVAWGIVESNFHYINTAKDQADLRAQLRDGEAPFEDDSGEDGTAWSGWCWDVKLADFANSGELEIAETNGFIRGATNRWPQLQELAMANDSLVANPFCWPNANAGDDIARQRDAALLRQGRGRPLHRPGPASSAWPCRSRPAASPPATPTATAGSTSRWPGSTASRSSTTTRRPTRAASSTWR